MVNSYGANAQKGISTFSVSITNNVGAKEFGDVGVSLRELRAAIGSTVAPEKRACLDFYKKERKKFRI